MILLSLFLIIQSSPCNVYASVCTPNVLKTLNSGNATYFVLGLHQPDAKIKQITDKIILNQKKGFLYDFFNACTNPDFRQKAEAHLIKSTKTKPIQAEAVSMRSLDENERAAFRKMYEMFFSELNVKEDRALFDALEGRLFVSLPQFSKLRFEFLKQYRGGPKLEPDLKTQCLETMRAAFSDDLISDVSRELPWQKYEARAKKIFSDLKQAYLVALKEKEMDAESLKVISQSLASLKLVVGSKSLEKMPTKPRPSINPENFFDLIRVSEKHLSPLSSNAQYSSMTQDVYLPIALLQEPLIDAQTDIGLRFILAHEIFHSVRFNSQKTALAKMLQSREQEWANLFLGMGYSAKVAEEVLADEWGFLVAQKSSGLPYDVFVKRWAILWCSLFSKDAKDYLKAVFVYPLGADRVDPIACGIP